MKKKNCTKEPFLLTMQYQRGLQLFRSWRLIEEFAFENGFKFTKAAQEKIELYKKQLKEVREVKNETI